MHFLVRYAIESVSCACSIDLTYFQDLQCFSHLFEKVIRWWRWRRLKHDGRRSTISRKQRGWRRAPVACHLEKVHLRDWKETRSSHSRRPCLSTIFPFNRRTRERQRFKRICKIFDDCACCIRFSWWAYECEKVVEEILEDCADMDVKHGALMAQCLMD